jgi:hypothetical protein
MTEEFKKMNEQYNDDTYPEFPYISKNRITVLQKGLYRKHGATYRGITAVYDEEAGKFKFPLYGMYYVPQDLVIVPDELEWNDAKRTFYHATITAGFLKTNRPPTFTTIEFPEDSPQAKLALANKASFHYDKFKKKDSNLTL